MSFIRKKLRLALIIFILYPTAIQATDHGKSASQANSKVSSKLSFGIGSDSNVTVDEIDSESGVRDSLWTFSADLDYKKKVTKTTDLRVGLSHSQDRFETFSEFDLGTSLVSTEISHDFGKINIGTALRYIVADLDSRNFLSISQASLNANGLLNKKMFLRADYTYSDTTFNDLDQRNATRHSLGTDLYYFLDGSKKNIAIGYKYQDENAVAAQFDRSTHNLSMRFKHTFSSFDNSLIGQLNASYRVRDYDAITPSIGLIRKDERYRVRTNLTLLLSASLFLKLEYEYSDYQSNFPAADYEQRVISMQIGWQSGR